MTLGAVKPLWDQLVDELIQEHKLTRSEWNCYSLKAGWSLRLKREARNIVYLSPSKSGLMASFRSQPQSHASSAGQQIFQARAENHL